jgi:hypothetical protein
VRGRVDLDGGSGNCGNGHRREQAIDLDRAFLPCVDLRIERIERQNAAGIGGADGRGGEREAQLADPQAGNRRAGEGRHVGGTLGQLDTLKRVADAVGLRGDLKHARGGARGSGTDQDHAALGGCGARTEAQHAVERDVADRGEGEAVALRPDR